MKAVRTVTQNIFLKKKKKECLLKDVRNSESCVSFILGSYMHTYTYNLKKIFWVSERHSKTGYLEKLYFDILLYLY